MSLRALYSVSLYWPGYAKSFFADIENLFFLETFRIQYRDKTSVLILP